MGRHKAMATGGEVTARTIRFPAALRHRISADADRCGRSFEGQVMALLRHHYGEDVDIRPAPAEILGLIHSSVSGMSAADLRLLERRLGAEAE